MNKQIVNKCVNYMIVPVSIVLQALLLVLMLQCTTFTGWEHVAEWLSVKNTFYMLYNLLLAINILFLFYTITKKLTPGYLVSGAGVLVIGIINNMKWSALKECVTFSDFSKLSEAVKVSKNAEFHIWMGMILFVAAYLAALVLCICVDVKWAKRLADKPYRRVNMWLAGILLVVLIPVIVQDGKTSAVAKLTENVQSEEPGPVIYFVESLFQEKINEAYTRDEAWNRYETYVEQGKKLVGENGDARTGNAVQQPNIIVIMSEAFYNLDRLEGAVSYSEDPMQPFREVCKEGISGDLYVNVYGGSTHFTEFEFLTGWNTRGMNTGSCPYKEYFSKDQPSFARYLKGQGYQTVAIHPYNGKFWNRYVAYPRLGFDAFIDQYRMSYQEKCGYISDDSLTKEIIKQFEEKKEGRPFFCFSVSVANHIAILNGEEKENAPDQIKVTYDDALGYGPNKKRWVQEYVSGIEKSGEALQELTDYLKTQDEPTIVVFFGDHAPSYALDQLAAGRKDTNLAYSTPYLIWGNYDWMTEKEAQNVSASYLSTYLIQLLDMPYTSQNYYNIAMRNAYPVETRYMIKNGKGQFYDQFTPEEQKDYYDHALDLKKHVETLLENPDRISDIWTDIPKEDKK